MAELKVWYNGDDYVVATSEQQAQELLAALWHFDIDDIVKFCTVMDDDDTVEAPRDPYQPLEDTNRSEFPMSLTATAWIKMRPWGHEEGKPFVIYDSDLIEDIDVDSGDDPDSDDWFHDDDDPFFNMSDYKSDEDGNEDGGEDEGPTVHLGFRQDCPCKKQFGQDCPFCKGCGSMTKWVMGKDDEDTIYVEKSDIQDETDALHAYATMLKLGLKVVRMTKADLKKFGVAAVSEIIEA